MNKKQYNNVIENTLKHKQIEASLSTARAIFDNMGVALPQGDIKTVYETISTDNYMGWKSCTMKEAQEAANNGTAAIGISEGRIVVLCAKDEEQPVAQTASVMTLDKNINAAEVEGLEYYLYSSITTRQFNSNYLINQADATILYPNGEKPGSENRAFFDNLFFGFVCGKTSAYGNIKGYGCAICTLAMFLLYKGNKNNTNNNVYYAVKEATIQGTSNSADFSGNGTYIYYYNGSAYVSANVYSTNSPDYYIQNGKKCIFRIKSGEISHYVLVYGINTSKSGTDKYLVADPDGGKMRSLTEAIQKRGLSANMSYITQKFVIE